MDKRTIHQAVEGIQDHPHACLDGLVYLTYTTCEDGEEVERIEAIPCRRCADSPDSPTQMAMQLPSAGA